MIRVAYLFGSLNRGGTEILFLDTFKNHSKANFEMIGIYRKEGALSEEFKKTTVPFFHLNRFFVFDISYFFRLRRLLKGQNINIVHAQQPLDALFVKIVCIGLPLKIVLTFHGYHGYRYTKSILSSIIVRIAIKLTDLNVFVSKTIQRYYNHNYKLKPNRQKVIYNGISFDKFEEFKFSSLREEFKINEKYLLIGSVGNFVAGRDQMTICRFLNLLKKNNIPFYFLFVGAKNFKDPRRYDECVKYCEENNLSKNVLFIGSRNDVPNILNQLDAFIYSSEHDSFGIAVIEAIAAGVTVFVNDLEIMQEITESKNAILYKSKDENDLLNKFLKFRIQNDLYLYDSKAHAKWAREKYNILTYMNTLEQAYKEF